MIDNRLRPFEKSELRIIDRKPGILPTSPKSPVYNTPISMRENAVSLFKHEEPMFVCYTSDFANVNVPAYNTNLGRGRDADDCFGIHWTFVPEVGGSISHEGNPKFTDADDWKDGIKIPDINEWDWETPAKEYTPDLRFPIVTTMVNGFGFERFISLMDFMNAAMALVDEDQFDSLYELIGSMYDLGIACAKKIFENYPYIDGLCFHDDWGTQKDPFFSEEAARELFLPHMKRFVDYIHSTGRYVEIHSCGHTEARIPIFIEAGIDTWQMQQTLNDQAALYEKYGDKMIIQISADLFPFDYSDDEQARAAARYYVDNFCKPGKPSMCLARTAAANQAFTDELYEYSRKHYLAIRKGEIK